MGHKESIGTVSKTYIVDQAKVGRNSINQERYTVKPVLSGHSKKNTTKLTFKTDYRLMQVKSVAECSKSILQYF